MKCPVCGAQNDEGTAYCYQCGSSLRSTSNPAPATGQTVVLGSDAWSDLTKQPPAPPAPANSGSNVYGSPPQPVRESRVYDTPPPEPMLRTSLPPEPMVQTSLPPSGQMPSTQAPYLVTSVQLSSTQTSTLAVFSLVMGILSFIFLPFIAAIGAIITGHMARREIQASNGRLTGAGLTLAGLILGYLNLFLSILVCAIIAILIASS